MTNYYWGKEQAGVLFEPCSQAAQKRGCTCSGHGGDKGGLFCLHDGCPLHGAHHPRVQAYWACLPMIGEGEGEKEKFVLRLYPEDHEFYLEFTVVGPVQFQPAGGSRTPISGKMAKHLFQLIENSQYYSEIGGQ